MRKATSKVPPIKEGETHRLKCITVGAKGDGICKKDGFVIIVPKTQPDKDYDVKITRVLPTVAFGEIV